MMQSDAGLRRLSDAGYVKPRDRDRCSACSNSTCKMSASGIPQVMCHMHRSRVYAGGWCPAYKAERGRQDGPK